MGYDDDARSGVHAELEAASKASKAEAEAKYHELEANRHADMDDADVKRGLGLGLTGSVALIDPAAREDPDAEPDPFSSGAFTPARHSESGEFESEAPVAAKRSSKKAAASSES